MFDVITGVTFFFLGSLFLSSALGMSMLGKKTFKARSMIIGSLMLGLGFFLLIPNLSTILSEYLKWFVPLYILCSIIMMSTLTVMNLLSIHSKVLRQLAVLVPAILISIQATIVVDDIWFTILSIGNMVLYYRLVFKYKPIMEHDIDVVMRKQSGLM